MGPQHRVDGADAMSSPLIANDQFTVWRPSRSLDEHGWATRDPMTEVGAEVGNIQADPNPTVQQGAQDRDKGPNQPAPYVRATAYLSPVTGVTGGDVLVLAAGVEWQVLSVTRITDPTFGGLATVVAQLEQVTS